MMNIRLHKGKQTEFVKDESDRIFFGGARGGSKSFSLAYKSALHVRRWHYEYQGKKILPQRAGTLRKKGKRPVPVVDTVSIDYSDYVGILIRRTFPQLERNLKPECDKIFKFFQGSWQERNKRYVFPSGATIYLVHCRDRKALENYIGGNYHFVGIDEANQFPWQWIEDIISSCRTSNKELKPFVCLTSNPGGIGHLSLKKNFVDRCRPKPVGRKIHDPRFDVSYQPKKSGDAYVDENGISWKYIPSVVFDNPSITDNNPKYVIYLKSLPPIRRAMWLEGDWSVFSGSFFDMWDEEKHVIPSKLFQYGKNFSKSSHKLFRFYDYGTHSPFVCLFAAIGSDRKMVIFDEIVQKGLSPSKQAKLVTDYSMEKYKLKTSDFEMDIADPAYQIKGGEKNGELYSPKSFYMDQNIYLTMANNDRKAGAKVVYNGLDIPEDGVPYIRFTDNCSYMIETMPVIPNSEKDIEDVDTSGDDHGYDALRYGAVEVLNAPMIAKPTGIPLWMLNMWKNNPSGGGDWRTA